MRTLAPALIVVVVVVAALGCDRTPSSDRSGTAPSATVATTTASTMAATAVTAAPSGIGTLSAGSGTVPVGLANPTKCAANQHFDNIDKKCRALGDCPKGYRWNEPSKMCVMSHDDDPSPTPSPSAAGGATKCGANQHYDAISKKCRPHGECPKGYRWNESMKSCVDDSR